MRAWFMVAASRPHQKFYAFTKSLGMWLTLKGIIPPNFYLTASQGGTLDYLIPKYPEVFQRVAYVVYTEEEAAERDLQTVCTPGSWLSEGWVRCHESDHATQEGR